MRKRFSHEGSETQREQEVRCNSLAPRLRDDVFGSMNGRVNLNQSRFQIAPSEFTITLHNLITLTGRKQLSDFKLMLEAEFHSDRIRGD